MIIIISYYKKLNLVIARSLLKLFVNILIVSSQILSILTLLQQLQNINFYSPLPQHVTATVLFLPAIVLMELASASADQNSFLHTVMSATLDTMVILNVNYVIAIPMELMVTYVKWVVGNVLVKQITEGKTAIDAKKNIMDFQIAYVSVQFLIYVYF